MDIMRRNTLPTFVRRLLPLLALLLVVVSGCGGATSDSEGGNDTASNAGSGSGNTTAEGGPVIVSFGVVEFQRQVYEPIAEAFNEQHDNIEVRVVSLDNIFGFTSGNSPDISTIINQVVRTADTADPLFPVRPSDIENGYLHDLQPLMDADPTFDKSDFYPHAFQNIGEEEGVYLLPNQLPVPLMSYNKSLWQSSGLPDPAFDWTWNDLIGAAEQISSKSGETIENYGVMTDGSGTVALVSELNAAGVDIFNTPVEEISLNDPAVQEVLERITTMAKNGTVYVPSSESGVVRFGPGEAKELIENGRVGLWIPDMLNNQFEQGEPAPLDFEVGTVPFPLQTPSFFYGTPQGYIMSSGTDHPQESWEWLSFLSRQNIEQPFGGSSISTIPARKSVAESSGYWDELDEETAKAVRAVLENPSAQIPPGLHNDVNIVFSLLNEVLGKVIGGDLTVTQALEQAQSDLEKRVADLQLTPEPTPDTSPIVVATVAPDTSSPKEGQTQIDFATVWLGAEDIRNLAESFNAENGEIFVNINNMELTQPEFAQVAAQNDCFLWFSSPGTSAHTATLDLKPLIDADASFAVDDYPSAFLSAYQDGSAIYGLPYAVDFRVLLHNKSAFDDMGVSYPTVDWTLDDMLNAAQQLDHGEKSNRTYGFASMSPTQDALFFITRFGGSYTTGSGETLEPNFTDPKVVEALRFYVNLLKEYSPHEEITGYRQGTFDSEVFQLVTEGRISMWLNYGVPRFGFMESDDLEIGTAPPPLGNSDVSLQDFQVRGFHISAESDHAEACWQWLTYLSDDTSMLQGGFPARTSLVESEAFQQNAYEGAMEVYEGYRQSLERSTGTSFERPDRSDFDIYWLMRAVDRALQGEDLERELETSQETTEQYLSCVKAGESKSTCATQVDPDYEGFNRPNEG